MISATIVDFGVGNLFSVRRALEKSGVDNVIVANTESKIEEAERLILPGVGAFSNGMKGLTSTNCIEPIKQHAKSGKPLLGICLGMQMLGTVGHEFGRHDGLDLIRGEILRIPSEDSSGIRQKVPFVGWAELHLNKNFAQQPHILGTLKGNPAVYLVHSYHFEADDPKHTVAHYDYRGMNIAAAVQRDNIMGLQFHPEKSSRIGLEILQHFIAL